MLSTWWNHHAVILFRCYEREWVQLLNIAANCKKNLQALKADVGQLGEIFQIKRATNEQLFVHLNYYL